MGTFPPRFLSEIPNLPPIRGQSNFIVRVSRSHNRRDPTRLLGVMAVGLSDAGAAAMSHTGPGWVVRDAWQQMS